MSTGSAIGGATTPPGIGLSAPASDTGGFSQLSSAEYFELVLTELSNQDPTEPQDTQALLEQIGLIRSIESDEAIVSQLGSLVDQSSFASAANLIGAEIRGLTADGRPVNDLVLSVTSTSDGAVLNLFNGASVPFENVSEVRAPIQILDDSGDDPADDVGDETDPPDDQPVDQEDYPDQDDEDVPRGAGDRP